MALSRVAVGALGGIAAGFAGLVGAVSLTRIAGDYLGFPPNLEWTFTGAVDVASVAGGIMWTAFDGPVRRIGRPMNIVCTIVSGVGVGLDHATHAGRALADSGAPDPWPWIAFAAGVFVPALATWILHALSIIFDTAGHHEYDREGTAAASNREAVNPTATPVRAAVSLIATTGPPTREADTVNAVTSRAAAAVSPAVTVRQAVNPTAPLPDAELPGPRQDWMTPDLVRAVVASMRDAGHPDPRYGEGSVTKDHRLPDGDRIGPSKARTLLRYIETHNLLRVAS